MAGDEADIAKTVGAGGHVLVLAADDRPDLPAVQSVAMADVDKRIEIIFGDDIVFARFAVNRKHHKKHFVAEQPVFEMSVKRKDRRVVQVRVRGSLLKIEGKKGKTLFVVNSLFLPAGQTQELDKLPALFLAVTDMGEQRIKKILLL